MPSKDIARPIGKNPTTISKKARKHLQQKSPTNFASSNHCSIDRSFNHFNVSLWPTVVVAYAKNVDL